MSLSYNVTDRLRRDTHFRATRFIFINQRLFRSILIFIYLFVYVCGISTPRWPTICWTDRLHPCFILLPPPRVHSRPLLLYYKWLWNIYKHHKFNLCRHCARRVYCAHNKRSSLSDSLPLPYPSSPPAIPPAQSYPAIEVIYYFYTFRVCVCVCIFVARILYIIHKI